MILDSSVDSDISFWNSGSKASSGFMKYGPTPLESRWKLSRRLRGIVRSCELTQVVDKDTRDRTQCSVLQGQNCHGPWPRRQFDIEYLHSEGTGIIACDRSWERRDI